MYVDIKSSRITVTHSSVLLMMTERTSVQYSRSASTEATS